MKVPINRILPYSFVDGPGNRAAVFVQNCNLACLYCHNPETQNLCFHCGECVSHCPASALSVIDGRVVWDKKKCVRCDTCIRICTRHASPKVEMMDAGEVIKEVEKSLPYIRGVTVSGGECSLYPDFLIELFTLAKERNLSTLLDSNGTYDFSLNEKLMEVTDGVMLDVKAWDDDVFMKLCHGHNDIVKKNLAFLSENNKLEEVRIVCLKGYTDEKAVIGGVADVLKSKKRFTFLKLIRFRRFGVKGELENMASPDMDYMNDLAEYAKTRGFERTLIL